MVMNPSRRTCVLSIDPCPRGFGFAVFEGSYMLLDWGVARVWGKSDAEFLVRIEGMINRYQPTLVLIEGDSPKRGARAKARLSLIARLAQSHGVVCRRIPSSAVREAFGPGVTTKYQMAKAIVERLPELEIHLPRERKPWTSEDERMNIFDALALAWTYLHGGMQEASSHKWKTS